MNATFTLTYHFTKAGLKKLAEDFGLKMPNPEDPEAVSEFENDAFTALFEMAQHCEIGDYAIKTEENIEVDPSYEAADDKADEEDEEDEEEDYDDDFFDEF